MAMNPIVRAIFRRDLRRWFGNPTGFVFITLFVLLATAALFGPHAFFRQNLANLDTLNDWFPRLLLLFIPAISMNVWAGERGQGTDELLLTLPASDAQIVLGKFSAAAGIYTLALLFTIPMLFLLAYLGDPDWGLLASNYLGYWLLGLTLLAAGMVGSQLSDNLTVAFILGAILCGLVVIAEPLAELILPGGARTLAGFGPVSLFREMARGVVSLSSLLLFAGLIAAFLYLNLLLLSRRKWSGTGKEPLHLGIRCASLLVAAVALTAMGANAGLRGDLTSERLHSLSPETRRIIDALPDDRVVQIQAYVSDEVPPDYVRTRRTLLDLLRQYEALGGGRIQVRVVPTGRYSDAAREAEENFDIRHQTRLTEEDGRTSTADIYLGVAFTCGLDEVVVPFLDKGLSVEYELTRSLRVVGSAGRRRVGILDNDVKVFGGFEFQAMRQDPEWSIVRELKLQYDVERVDPAAEYPADLDALVALMPSSLTQEEMDRLQEAIENGLPTLLIDDPFPAAAPGLGPGEPKGGRQNPFTQQAPPTDEKGDVLGMLRDLGVEWSAAPSLGGFGSGRAAPVVVWDEYNPHPQFEFDPEIVFVGSASAPGSFNQDEVVSAGLQELVMIFGGSVREAPRSGLEFTPLLQTTKISGTIGVDQLFRMDPFFGGRSMNPARAHRSDGRQKIMACRVRGTAPAAADTAAQKPIDLTFVADLDMISDQFFEIRRQGVEMLNLDNVTFLLNCVDQLAGDTSFIELRKRRPVHRTLTRIEAEDREFDRKWLDERAFAEQEAAASLAEAQARLDERVAELEKRTDLDEQSKAIQIQSIRDVEQRRLDVRKAAIEDAKNRALDEALARKLEAADGIRQVYRVSAVFVPLPAVLFGLFTLVRRSRRERETTRRDGAAAAPQGAAS